MKTTKHLLLAFAAAFALAQGCTKNKELKDGVNPDSAENTIAKSELEGLLQMSRGVEEADSENTVGATPGMSEDFGLVKVRITSGTLQFLSAYDPMGRPATNNVVASYPILKQFDIKRERNDYGEETNKIIEDESEAWAKRAYIRVDWKNPKTSMTQFAKTLQRSIERANGRNNGAGDDEESGGPSLGEENTVLLEAPKNEKGHISFVVETSVTNSGDSNKVIYPMAQTGQHAYRVTYRTHILKVQNSDFKPVPYTLKDFEKFGYFFTQQNVYGLGGSLKDENVVLKANVHNVCEPGRNESCSTNRIRWVLNKDFPDKYKDMADKVIAEWNETFKTALGRTDDVVYLDKSVQADISDSSQNVLALYPSRTRSGLLGVAQWISNPMTGELRGVRATTYGDGIDSVVQSVDDLIDILVSEDPLADMTTSKAFGTRSTPAALKARQFAAIQKFAATRRELGFETNAVAANDVTTPKLAQNAVLSRISSPEKQSIKFAKLASQSQEFFAVKESSLLQNDASGLRGSFPTKVAGIVIPDLNGMQRMIFAGEKASLDKRELMHDAETGVHGVELVEDAAIRFISQMLKNGKTVEDLKNEREQIKEQIAQLTFYTTMLHEMGHAFGLRHNFEGSADRAHYAKQYFDIAKDMTDNKENSKYVLEDLEPFASSSIMDYGRDFFSQQAGLGEYDKAAIKYLYNRSLDRESDPIVLAKFKFCTDHMVDEDILCRRFDKGSTVSESTQGNIDLYNARYVQMHNRRGRLQIGNSNAWGSPGALVNSLLSRMMFPIRQVMDEFTYRMYNSGYTNMGGYCVYKFVGDAVANKEIADICDPVKAEAAGVDYNDVSTFVNALLKRDPATGQVVGFYKAPALYQPNGFADLAFANSLAQDFFASVIGSPSAGSYLKAENSQTGETRLISIPDGPTVEAQLTAFAQQNGYDVASILKGYSDKVVVLREGLEGKELNSQQVTEGGWSRVQSLGSIWDKYAALITLRTESLPVQKYHDASMSSNPYFLPQTRPFMKKLMGSIITGSPYIGTIQLREADGSTLIAGVPAELNSDLADLATISAIGAMVSETDRSMLGLLQICDINQRECSKVVDTKKGADAAPKTVSFRSSQGGNIYRATQTTTNDSIAFALVSQAAVLDKQRTEVIAARDDKGLIQAKNLEAIATSGELQARVLAEIAADEILSLPYQATKDLLIDSTAIMTGVFGNLKQATQIITKAAQPQRVVAILNQMIQDANNVKILVTMRKNSLGDAGKCWLDAQPKAVVPAAKPADVAPLKDFDLGSLLAFQATTNNSPAVAPQAAAKPAPPGPFCNDEASGHVLMNLTALEVDIAAAVKLATDVLKADTAAISAPFTLARINQQLAQKEAQIERIRTLSKRVSN